MGLIVRTAGAATGRSPRYKRDCEYLMRLWDDVREHTMCSVAPALIYEEASLIKRSIRDVYSRDLDRDSGRRRGRLEDGARDFMRMLMPEPRQEGADLAPRDPRRGRQSAVRGATR